MEVHAHSHTSRQKWTHYFWEFLMLFLAVTLGFYAENLREGILHKKEVKTNMRSLQEAARPSIILRDIHRYYQTIERILIQSRSIIIIMSLQLVFITGRL